MSAFSPKELVATLSYKSLTANVLTDDAKARVSSSSPSSSSMISYENGEVNKASSARAGLPQVHSPMPLNY